MALKSYSKYVPLGILIIAWFSFPLIFHSPYFYSQLVEVGLWFITAIGYNMVLGNAGQFSFGHGAFIGVGAYATSCFYALLGINYWWSLLIAIVITSVVGCLIAFIAVRLGTFYLAIATIAFHLIFYSFVTRSHLVRAEIGFKVPRPSLAGIALDSEIKYFYLIWIIALLVMLFSRNLISSKFGRMLKAIQEDELAAETTGINVLYAKVSVFTLSAVFAAITGGLMAPYLGWLSPHAFEIHTSFSVLNIVIIGGLGSIWGSLIGSFFITMLPEGIRFLASLPAIPAELYKILTDDIFRHLLFAIFLFFCIAFLPKGIAGAIADMWSRVSPSTKFLKDYEKQK